MAISILWLDGFDEIGNTNQKYKAAPEADPQAKPTHSSVAGITSPFGYGRFCEISGGYLSKTLPAPPYQTLFSAFYMWAGRVVSAVSDRKIMFEFVYDGSSVQCHIALKLNNVTGKFDAILVRGTTDLYTWQTPIRFGQWHHISIMGIVADSGGRVRLAVDGQDLGTFIGDTSLSGVSAVHRLRLRSTDTTDKCFFVDNWIVATGYYNDPLLPPTRVYGAVVPNADVSVAWTKYPDWNPELDVPFSNWELVDEIPADGDVTYNSDHPYQPDVFSNEPIPNLGTNILALKVNCMSRSTNSPSYDKIYVLLHNSGVYYNSPKISIPDNTNPYFIYGQIWQNNPQTSLPWTPEEVQNIEFGYRRAPS